MSELDYYWDLSSNDPELREKSALKIIENVRLTIPKNPKKKDCNDPEQILENILGENGFYALKRLVKGLSSSRDHSRLGFSTTLSEFLSEFKNIDVEHVIKLIEKYTEIQGNVSSNEEKDLLFGRLFGFKAISISKMLQRTKSIESIENVINMLISLSFKKGWLREPCFSVINDILIQLESLSQFHEIYSIILRKICDLKLSKTPEGVAIILTIQKIVKDLKPIGDTQWNPLSPLDSSNLEILAKVLKDVNIDSETKQRGNWSIRLHFVWDIIIETYTSKISNIANSSFLDFWTKVIDESLFSATSSLEKKFWGFQIFNLTLPKIEISNISHMFSKNFMRCFINHLSDKDRYLNKISNRVLLSILSVADTRKEIILPITKSLLGPLGALNFDKITKTKLVESLISLANEKELWDILQLLKTITCFPNSKDIKDIEQKRQISVDIMLSILRNKKCNKNNKWIADYITFFSTYAYFDLKSNFQNPFSVNTKIILRSRLSSSLAYLNSQNESNMKFYKNLHEQFFWSSFIIKLIIFLSKSEKYNLSIIMNPKVLEVKNKSMKIFKKILKKKSNSKGNMMYELFAFELLYSLSILQLYNGDPEASSVLRELKICYNNFFNKKTKSTSNEDTIEVLIDILLGFLSKQSILFRKLVEQVLKTNESSKNTLFYETFSDENYDNSNYKSFNNNENATGDLNDEINDIKMDDVLENTIKDIMNIPTENIENNFQESASDQQMFELDKHIADILKQRKNQKNKKKAISIKNSVIEFKSKVLDILDIFLKARDQDPIIFNLIVPLLVLIRTTSNDIVLNKARNLIGNRLCKAKINIDDVNIEIVSDLLKQVHDDGLKIKKKTLGTAHSQCSIFLIKIIISKDINLINRVLEIYFNTFNNWITKQKIKLHASFFIDLISWGNQFKQKNKKIKNKKRKLDVII
ncbi:hypothetical protein PMAC_000209 [Pneumocystis sp. 'macacae']|nr:hypothetical protein PMAC_000209 [Pneumocystis sp. 'macacae']